MTLTEFLFALKATPRNWTMERNGGIRGVNPETGYPCCPVVAVGDPGGDWTNEDAFELAGNLGFDEETAEAILSAADYPSRTGYESRLRQAILWATDLKEIDDSLLLWSDARPSLRSDRDG